MQKSLGWLWRPLREALAVGFWIYVPIKLFVYDIDRYVANSIHGRLLDVLTYKAVGLGAIVIVWWLTAGNRRFARDISFVICYPAIVLFWYLPKTFLRSWLRAFVLLFGVIATVRALKFRLVLNFVAVSAAIVILGRFNRVASLVAMPVLILYLLIQYARQVRAAFSPTTFLRRVTNILTRQWVDLREKMITNNLNELGKQPTGSEAYAKTRLNQLQFLYIINRLSVIVASKLRMVQQSRLVLAYFLMTLAFLFGITVLTFGLEYYALSGLDPAAFVPGAYSRLWYYLYFSVSTMLNATVDSTAQTVAAMILVTLQRLCAALVLVIFVSIVVMVLRERYDEDIRELINHLGEEGRWIEEASEKRYGITFRDAEVEIRQLAPGIVTFLALLEGGRSETSK